MILMMIMKPSTTVCISLYYICCHVHARVATLEADITNQHASPKALYAARVTILVVRVCVCMCVSI